MDKPKKAEIAAIRKIIKELPKGNVSPKTISGKVRYYLQWSEDGRRRSKYVPAGEVADVRERIVRRKALELRLKELTDAAAGHAVGRQVCFRRRDHADAELHQRVGHALRRDIMLSYE